MEFSRLFSKRVAGETRESISATNSVNEVDGLWSELPSELLEVIAIRLGLIELISFRSVCKEWRSASAQIIKSTTSHVPWFLLYEDNEHCRLYDPSSQNFYTIHIPELEGASCIASNDGWLLLYRDRSVFFFCPFSGAKIDLLQFPHLELSGHVAGFSYAPTSPDCIVCVVNHTNSTRLELNVLRRGANEWAKHGFRCNQNQIETITCATFCDGIFYFLDSLK